MAKLARWRRGSFRGERGATAVEYALMITLIALVIFAAVSQIGPPLSGIFAEVASSL